MNNIYNTNGTINTKYLHKSVLRSSNFETQISDTTNFQFDIKNPNLKKDTKPFKTIMVTNNSFAYFLKDKTDLKFVFLKKTEKSKNIKNNNILQNMKCVDSNCLITKLVKFGFRVISHKYKGLIKTEHLKESITEFKIQLLNKPRSVNNQLYLEDLHELNRFIFYKLLFTHDTRKYINFRFLKKKNKKLKLKKRLILKSDN